MLVALMLVAASCSSAAENGSSDTDDSSAESEPTDELAFGDDDADTDSDADADDRMVLEVTAWKGTEAEPAGLPELIADFEQEHPDIRVELQVSSRVDTDVVVVPRVKEGAPPDVMMTDLVLAKALAGEGLLVDLDVDSDWYGRLEPSLRDAITTDEQVYLLPLEVIGMGNFVNTSLLSQVGIDEPPTNIDDLLRTCGLLADAGISPMIVTYYSATLLALGIALQATTAETTDFVDGTRRFVDDPAFQDALDVLRDMIDNRCFDPEQQAGLDPWSTALTAFSEGQYAMMPQGAWNILSFVDVEGLDFAFAPMPSFAGGVGLEFPGIGWSVPADGDQMDAAVTFVEWFARPDRIQVLIDDEAAYTPFDDGSSGTPALASSYDQARRNGASLNYPFSTLEWPGELGREVSDSLTEFLLDPTMTNDAILARWDAWVVANS